MARVSTSWLKAAAVASVAFMPIVAATSPSFAADVKVIVNDEAVTSYDIQRRAAFLKLQRKSGNLSAQAEEELITDALKTAAIRKAGIRIPDSMVNDAYSNFAKSNKLTTSQLSQILDQSGVTSRHFKEFIRLQIGWSQTVQIRSRRSAKLMNEQDVVAKMLEQGGAKPTSTEYLLQQVIFVVPDGGSKSKAARRKEAESMRSRVSSCEGTKQLAAGLRDVSVRDLGRVLELQLPDAWSKDVSGLQTGQSTRVKDTDRGVEFIIVCRARAVNDDRVAQLQFSTEALEAEGGDEAERFLKELRDNAKIRRP